MVPSELRANFNITITVEDKASEVPDGYTPKFVLGGVTSLVKNGSVVDSNLEFAFVAGDTDDLTTGQYWYEIIAESGDNRVFVDDGTIFVIAKMTGTGSVDRRSVAEQIVSAIDAMIAGKASIDQQSYVIQSGSGSRSLSRLSLEDLNATRKIYASIVAAERRAKGDAPLIRRHLFKFTND